MKIFKTLSLITFIIIIISCQKSVTESKEYTLVGKWSFSSAQFSRVLTTNSNQTIKLPFSGIGSIKIIEEPNVLLNSLYVNNTDGQVISVYGAGEYISALLEIDSGNRLATYYSGITGYVYSGAINYSFNGMTLIIIESTLINQENASDSINISGDISFETVNVLPHNSITIEIPSFLNQYPRGYIQFEFQEDGTFLQTTNSNDGSITSLGTWESTGNTITTTITEGNNTEIHTIEYSIEANLLTGTEEYDLCQSDDECLNTYENHYQIDAGSLESVRMISNIVFRAVTDI